MNLNTRDEIMKKLGLDTKSLDELVEDAHREISALCHGKHWTMCVPVQGDDSDIIISEALQAQTREIQRLRVLGQMVREPNES